MKKNNSIAIVGMAFRFPGGLQNEGTLWDTLKSGHCTITQVPEDRWPTDALQHPNRAELGRSVTFSAGVLPHLDSFDSSFFGISPREAACLDPQQRLLLTLAYEALENAHIPSKSMAGSNCGVYIGISSIDYGMIALGDLSSMASHAMTGNTMSIAANRISYVFDLHGPSLAIDTACSSSLVALHYACEAIRNKQIPLALVGGVNVLMHPYAFVGFSKASMISDTGQSLPFDARANGYVRAEGSVVLVLKPLEKALADNDYIHGIIRGSGVNTDGKRKTGITIPSPAGQTELMKKVLKQSGVEAADIDFVEMHGTGTPVGDPIEVKSVAEIYAKNRKDNPLLISSIKANLGHLEPASGLTGLVKALLVCKNKAMPPAPKGYIPSPYIDFKGLNVHYPTKLHPIKAKSSDGIFTAVNSFGFGGVNAHIVIQHIDNTPIQKEKLQSNTLDVAQTASENTLPPLFLSAQSKQSLQNMAVNFANELENSDACQARNIAYTAAMHRNQLEKRLCVSGATPHDIAAELKKFAAGDASEHLVEQSPEVDNANIAFVYSGNGSQWVGMAKTLLDESEEFVNYIEEIDSIMHNMLGFSCKEMLRNCTEEKLAETAIAQPLLFAIQIALTRMLENQGIRPKAVIGHSVGEVAAAWAAGALDLAQAIQVICVRSQCQSETGGLGKMAAVKLAPKAAEELLVKLSLQENIFISGINAPQHITLAGSTTHLEELQKYCSEHSILFKFLGLNYAFHSPYMDGIKEKLLKELGNLKPQNTKKVAFISAVTGKGIVGTKLDAQYWWENVRKPVLFAKAAKGLLDKKCSIFVEIGPHAILQRYLKDCIVEAGKTCCVLPTLLKTRDNLASVTNVSLRVRMAQQKPDLSFYFPEAAQRVALPAYPWQQESHWLRHTSERVWEKRYVHPLLGWAIDGTDLSFENVLDPATLPWLIDHKVGEACVFPGAGYVELALALARQWLGDSGALEGLDILAPLVFDNSVAQTVRTTLNSYDGTFKIYARPRLSTNPWMLYAAGRIIEHDALTPIIDAVPARSEVVNEQEFNSEAVYEAALGLGLEYGPSFQGINVLRMDNGYIDADVSWPEFDERYILHPAILDACFHSLVALLVKYDAQSLGQAYLPIKTGSVKVWQRVPVVRICVQIVRHGKRSLVANCSMFDAQGKLVAEAANCRFMRASLLAKVQHEPRFWQTKLALEPLPRTQALPVDGSKIFDTKTKSPAREKWFTQTLPLLEVLTLSSAVQALRKVEDKDQSMDTNYGTWLMGLLEQEGLAKFNNNTWRLDSGDLPSPHELIKELLHEAPESLTQLLQIGRVGLNLQALLQDSNENNFDIEDICKASVVKGLSQNDPMFTGIHADLCRLMRSIAAELAKGSKINILQIGVNHGDIVHTLTSSLHDDQFNLTLACEDDEILHQYKLRYADYENISFVKIDLKAWEFADQDLHRHGFDVVIANHVLHNAAEISSALSSLYNLVLPKGLLLVAERYPDWSADFVHGLEQDWWSKNNHSSLFAPTTWQQLLEEMQFSDCTIYTEPEAADLTEGAYLVIAKRDNNIQTIDIAKQSWLLLCDNSTADICATLKKDLSYSGQNVIVHNQSPKDFCEAYPDNIVFIRGREVDAQSAARLLDNLRQHAVKAVAQKNSVPKLWIVTQGGALVSVQGKANPVQSTLWGMGRVIMNEFPELKCKLVDVDNSLTTELCREFLTPNESEEIIITAEGRYALKVEPNATEQDTVNNQRFRLDMKQQGKLSNLQWFADTEKTLDHDDVEVRVMATGLNFRDVMFALGLLPEDVVENGFAGATLGLEFSGIVHRVGRGVDSVQVGDLVVGFAPSSFSSHVVTKAHAVAMLAKDNASGQWNYETAASIPTVFFTAYYALKHLAQMQQGESLLIHGAAGGVGLAAIQIARHLGLTIYATAGSDEKRDLLKLLGVEHIFDSRSVDFASEILAKTEGKGVDAVLNSLAGEPMRRSIALLKPFGRFLELGKRDFVENTAVGLRPFKENISYFSIDADQILIARPALASSIFKELMSLFHDNTFSPLPVRAFSPDNIRQAFVTMQQAQHVGKIVVSLENPPSKIFAATPEQPKKWQGRGTWLISGGLEGFGHATAQWLAENGVKQLVLASRKGQKSPKAKIIQKEFAAKGINVHIAACDVSKASQVQDLIQHIQDNFAPLCGVIHAAAVYDDKFMPAMNSASLQKVLGPKFVGALNLHEATRSIALDHFVLYSSISAYLGNPGQANYVAANAGEEGLVLLRKSMGLPATCIAWGPIGDVGYLTKHEAVKKSLEQHLGAATLDSGTALNTLHQSLTDSTALSLMAPVDWGAVKHSLPHGAKRFSKLFHNTKSSKSDELSEDFVALLKDKSPEEAVDFVCIILIEEIAQVLSYDAARIEKAQTLQSIGMDSLMAVELAVSLEQRFGIRLPAMLLQDAPTVEKVASRIVERLLDQKTSSTEEDSILTLAASHGETVYLDNIDQLKSS